MKTDRKSKPDRMRAVKKMPIKPIKAAFDCDEDNGEAIGHNRHRMNAKCFRTGKIISGFTHQGLYLQAQILGWGAIGVDWDICGSEGAA